MNGPTRQIETGFASEEVPTPGHICLIYESENVRQRVVAAYMAAGLMQGEVVRYLSDSTPPDEVRSWLANVGVRTEEPERAGAFGIVNAIDAYCPDGGFDPTAMIDRLRLRYKQAAQTGYPGTRSCGEMGWIFKHLPGSERWLEYESLLNTPYDSFPHSGMCQYDARMFDGATLFKILELHPQIMAQGQIVRNPFYIRPESFADHCSTT